MIWRAVVTTWMLVNQGGRYHDDNVLDRCVALACGEALPFGPTRPDRLRSRTDRWKAAHRAAPDWPVFAYALSANLRKLGDLGQAKEVIDEALVRFPDDLGTAIEAARVAELCGDHLTAYTQWHHAIRKGRPRALWLNGAAQALVLLGRFDEAEAILSDALRAHRSHSGLEATNCLLASSRQDWAKAVPLWMDFVRRYPKHPYGWELLGRAIYSAKVNEPVVVNEAEAMPSVRADVGRVEDEDVRHLLLAFESLGDNCEFGLVQRRFGAEPTDLLRWNIVNFELLIDALHHDMAGVGEPENTELTVLSSKEFFAVDRRWYLGMHTFLFDGQTTHETLFPAVCFRSAALRTTFLERLAGGGRIYVYRSLGLSRDHLLALHQALQKHGVNTLLAVQPAEPGSPSPFRGRPGTISVIEPGCLVGFVSRLGVSAAGTWDIAFDDWIAVCRHALAAAPTAAMPRPEDRSVRSPAA